MEFDNSGLLTLQGIDFELAFIRANNVAWLETFQKKSLLISNRLEIPAWRIGRISIQEDIGHQISWVNALGQIDTDKQAITIDLEVEIYDLAGIQKYSGLASDLSTIDFMNYCSEHLWVLPTDQIDVSFGFDMDNDFLISVSNLLIQCNNTTKSPTLMSLETLKDRNLCNASISNLGTFIVKNYSFFGHDYLCLGLRYSIEGVEKISPLRRSKYYFSLKEDCSIKRKLNFSEMTPGLLGHIGTNYFIFETPNLTPAVQQTAMIGSPISPLILESESFIKSTIIKKTSFEFSEDGTFLIIDALNKRSKNAPTITDAKYIGKKHNIKPYQLGLLNCEWAMGYPIRFYWSSLDRSVTTAQQDIPIDAVITIFTREGLALVEKPAYDFTAEDASRYATDHIWQLAEQMILIK